MVGFSWWWYNYGINPVKKVSFFQQIQVLGVKSGTGILGRSTQIFIKCISEVHHLQIILAIYTVVYFNPVYIYRCHIISKSFLHHFTISDLKLHLPQSFLLLTYNFLPKSDPFFQPKPKTTRKPHQILLAFSKAEILASSEKCCEMKRRNQEDVYEIITLEVQVHYTPGSPRKLHFSFRVVHEFHHFIVRCIIIQKEPPFFVRWLTSRDFHKHGIVVCRGWFHHHFQGIDTFDCRLEFQG